MRLIMWLKMITVITSSLAEQHYNERDGVTNHRRLDCLLNHLFGHSSNTGEFPAQRASNAENVSIRWRHHENFNVSFNLINPGFQNSVHSASRCAVQNAVCYMTKLMHTIRFFVHVLWICNMIFTNESLYNKAVSISYFVSLADTRRNNDIIITSKQHHICGVVFELPQQLSFIYQ